MSMCIYIYMSVGMIIPNIWKICSKPPTSIYVYVYIYICIYIYVYIYIYNNNK